MKTIHLVLLSAMLICTNVVDAQSVKSRYYFVTSKNDTTFCKELDYDVTLQGYLSKVEYIDINGNKAKLEGRSKVPDVITFYLDTIIKDKVPLKANKPNGYIKYTTREVDGKLRVYLSQQGYIYVSPDTYGPTGLYRFYIKFPDGKYYKINKKKNMKTIIIPYLEKCKEFKAQYKGNYSHEEEPFMETIRLYNSLCK